MNQLSPSPRLSPPAGILARVVAVLIGLFACCAIAHAEGLMPTAVRVSQTPTSACQSEALRIGFQLGGQARVTGALVKGLTPPCFDKPYRLTVVGVSGAVIDTATGSTGRAATIAVPVDAVAAADVASVTMSVTG